MGQGLQELQTPPWNLSATRKQTGGGQHLLRPGFESLHLHISGSGTQLSSVHRADKKTEAGSKECENISLQEQAQGGSSCKSSMPRNCTRTKAARPTKPLLEKPNITPLWNFFFIVKEIQLLQDWTWDTNHNHPGPSNRRVLGRLGAWHRHGPALSPCLLTKIKALITEIATDLPKEE